MVPYPSLLRLKSAIILFSLLFQTDLKNVRQFVNFCQISFNTDFFNDNNILITGLEKTMANIAICIVRTKQVIILKTLDISGNQDSKSWKFSVIKVHHPSSCLFCCRKNHLRNFTNISR